MKSKYKIAVFACALFAGGSWGFLQSARGETLPIPFDFMEATTVPAGPLQTDTTTPPAVNDRHRLDAEIDVDNSGVELRH
jgi:hypothetical protein